ncbi:MAG: SGNH/GDSL hydrolase family protein [Planctomycetota bacterium]
MSQTGFFHRHRFATLAVVVLTLLSSLLFGLEALLAWRAPEPAQPTHRAIRLREHKPRLDLDIPMPDQLLRDPDSLAQGSVHLAIDADGFIEPSKVHEEADFTVVFLGGSTTECLWVQEDNRFPFVAGRLLEESGAWEKVNSYNAGRSANHSLHSIAALLGKVLPLEPDVCVMMHNCNDLMVLLLGQTYWSTQIAFRNMIEARRYRESVRSRASDLIRQLFPHILELFSPVQVADELAPLRGREITPDPEFIERNFRRSQVTFVNLCRTWGIRPVLMTQANRITEQLDPQFERLAQTVRHDFGQTYERYYQLYHRMNEIVREVGRELDVPVVDLAAAIPQTKEFVYDPYHLNDAGSRRAAELIAEALRQLPR